MGKTMLPQDLGVALMRKLATDDAFRARFESDPAAGLGELGADKGLIDGLDAGCCRSGKLAPKDDYAKLLDDADSEQFHAAMSMHVHQIRI